MKRIVINHNRLVSTLKMYNDVNNGCRRAEFMDRERMNSILDKMIRLAGTQQEMIQKIQELKDYLKKTPIELTKLKVKESRKK